MLTVSTFVEGAGTTEGTWALCTLDADKSLRVVFACPGCSQGYALPFKDVPRGVFNLNGCDCGFTGLAEFQNLPHIV